MTIHFDRLLKLADFLETVPADKFSYGWFVGPDTNGTDSAATCGTTACALGWATAIEEFRDLGLRLSRGAVVIVGSSSVMDGWGGSLDAARRIFGLTEGGFEKLFVPSSHDDDCLGCGPIQRCVDPESSGPCDYASAAQVSAHIRRFVEERRK